MLKYLVGLDMEFYPDDYLPVYQEIVIGANSEDEAADKAKKILYKYFSNLDNLKKVSSFSCYSVPQYTIEVTGIQLLPEDCNLENYIDESDYNVLI